MSQANQKTRGKNVNFFPAPHVAFDDDRLRNSLTHAERDFLMVLCHLSNRYANKDGWFWHTDRSFKTRDDKDRGFASYGFSKSTCKRVRKKLAGIGLIEIKSGSSERGHRAGTMYRISKLLQSTRAHYEPWPEATVNLNPRPP